MSYTFVCTPHKEWYLKISTLEDLLAYWKTIFNPQIKEAYETMLETKEFGCGMNHSTALQTAIGLTARGEGISLKAAYEKLKGTRDSLTLAMKQFEGTNRIENYLDYSTLKIALECVVSEMDRFVNKDWK